MIIIVLISIYFKVQLLRLVLLWAFFSIDVVAAADVLPEYILIYCLFLIYQYNFIMYYVAK